MIVLLACAQDQPMEADVHDTSPAIDPFDGALHRVEIELEALARASLLAEPYEQVEAELRFDGLDLGRVGVKLRGKEGSFRPLDEKPKWKIEFDAAGGGLFAGLEHLDLDNAVADCSYLRAPLAFAVLEELGEAASRTGFATLVVDGEDYGLYVLVEDHDEHWLARGPGAGNLYDGSYVYEDGAVGQKLDFEVELVARFTLEEGEDVGHADLRAVAEGLDAGRPLGELLDEAGLASFVAAERWVGHLDGYVLNQNNYQVWFGPELRLFGWDYDEAFLEPEVWGMDWEAPVGRLATALDEAVLAEALAALDVDEAALSARYLAWDEATLAAAEADPRRECAARKLSADREDLHTWLLTRDEALSARQRAARGPARDAAPLHTPR